MWTLDRLTLYIQEFCRFKAKSMVDIIAYLDR